MLTSPVYSSKRIYTPIDKQSATGIGRDFQTFRSGRFMPLNGKGCFKWAFAHCRRCSGRRELVGRIATEFRVPSLEVVAMVDDWLEKGLAIWDGEQLVLKRKRKELSSESRGSFCVWLIVRPKVVAFCRAISKLVRGIPQFWILKTKRKYDVGIEFAGFLQSADQWAMARGISVESLRGSRKEVAMEVMMLRAEFSVLTGLEEGGGPVVIPSVEERSDGRIHAHIESMIKSMK